MKVARLTELPAILARFEYLAARAFLTSILFFKTFRDMFNHPFSKAMIINKETHFRGGSVSCGRITRCFRFVTSDEVILQLTHESWPTAGLAMSEFVQMYLKFRFLKWSGSYGD